MELEFLEFNYAYMFKQKSTDTMSVYMSAKEGQGINVVLLENEKNQKQYFFYVFGQQGKIDNGKRLIRNSWFYTKLVIRNIASYIYKYTEPQG